MAPRKAIRYSVNIALAHDQALCLGQLRENTREQHAKGDAISARGVTMTSKRLSILSALRFFPFFCVLSKPLLITKIILYLDVKNFNQKNKKKSK